MSDATSTPAPAPKDVGVAEISQSTTGSGDANSARSYKEMIEAVKKLSADADKLTDRISGLHCQFADLALKGSFLFDPATIELMHQGQEQIGAKDPADTHFMRKVVDEQYEDLVQRLAKRPSPTTQDNLAEQ